MPCYQNILDSLKTSSTENLKDVEVSSVDNFQGQEREAIVMSFVRNNKENKLGFLTDYRRLNVAITRAKRQFFLVGSSKMLRYIFLFKIKGLYVSLKRIYV